MTGATTMTHADEPLPWQPVLTGSLAAEATRATGEIAAALRDPPPGWGANRPAIERAGMEIGLPWGRAGMALLFHYLGLATGSTAQRGTAHRLLRAAVEIIAVLELHPSLYGVFLGIA